MKGILNFQGEEDRDLVYYTYTKKKHNLKYMVLTDYFFSPIGYSDSTVSLFVSKYIIVSELSESRDSNNCYSKKISLYVSLGNPKKTFENH